MFLSTHSSCLAHVYHPVGQFPAHFQVFKYSPTFLALSQVKALTTVCQHSFNFTSITNVPSTQILSTQTFLALNRAYAHVIQHAFRVFQSIKHVNALNNVLFSAMTNFFSSTHK